MIFEGFGDLSHRRWRSPRICCFKEVFHFSGRIIRYNQPSLFRPLNKSMLNISWQEYRISRFQLILFITHLEMIFSFEYIKILILERMNMQWWSAMGCKTSLFEYR